MPAGRLEPDQEVQPVRAASGESPRRHVPEVPADAALSRRRPVHDLGADGGHLSPVVQAGNAVILVQDSRSARSVTTAHGQIRRPPITDPRLRAPRDGSPHQRAPARTAVAAATPRDQHRAAAWGDSASMSETAETARVAWAPGRASGRQRGKGRLWPNCRPSERGPLIGPEQTRLCRASQVVAPRC